MIIDNLNGDDCPASDFHNIERIKKTERLRKKEIKSIQRIKLFLLCESAPEKRFVYDLNSQYSKNGLRYLLRNELVDAGNDEKLFDYLRKQGVLIVDCALCSLHKLSGKKDRRAAATICLERHTQAYLDLNPEAPIVAIFPSKCGFYKRKLPHIQGRVKHEFRFTNLTGLKDTICALTKGNSSSK